MTTRHELIIGDNIIATTYIDPARGGQDIFMYDVPRWDDIPEAIRNTSENKAGQGTKISKRRRFNGKEFTAVLGARNDTMAIFELRDELISLNKSDELFDITLIRYIEVLDSPYPKIRTETFEDCVITGDITWVWQGEDDEESDVEITINFRSQNAEPIVTIEDGNPDEQAINTTVIQDANASHLAISTYVTGIYPMPTEQELEALLVLTGENTGEVEIVGQNVIITITSPITGFTQSRNTVITIDWSEVNALVDSDIAATLSAIEDYLPETLEEPLTLADIEPFIVQNDDNVITLRIQSGTIFVDGLNPRSGYTNVASVPVPPVDNPDINASLQQDVELTELNIIELVKFNRNPSQAELNNARNITNNNVITVARNGDEINITGSNPGTTFIAQTTTYISTIPDWAAINASVDADIVTNKATINNYIDNIWDGVSEITDNTLAPFVTSTGENEVIVYVSAGVIYIEASSPITSYVATPGTITIPQTGEPDLQGDLQATLEAIETYAAQNPDFVLADLEPLKVEGPGVTIILTEDANLVYIEGTDGTETSTLYFIKETVDNQQRKLDIDNSLADTTFYINDWIVQNPDGPFDLGIFETLVSTYGEAIITMTLTEGVLRVEAKHNPADIFFPYVVFDTITLPSGGGDAGLESDVDATGQNITDFWTSNPTWDPQFVSDWSTFIVVSDADYQIYAYAQSANSVIVSGQRTSNGYYYQITVVNPSIDVPAIKASVDADAATYENNVNTWLTNNPGEVLTNMILQSLFPTPTTLGTYFNGSRMNAEVASINATNSTIGYSSPLVVIENIIPEQWILDAKAELQAAVQATQANINAYIVEFPEWVEDDILYNDALLVSPATFDYGNSSQIRQDWDNPGLPPVAQGYSPNISYSYFWSNTDSTFIEN